VQYIGSLIEEEACFVSYLKKKKKISYGKNPLWPAQRKSVHEFV
jgi:hypothetical protein